MAEHEGRQKQSGATPMMKPPNVPECRAARDGDCIWKECPQAKDYQSYCPYAKAWEEYLDAIRSNADD